METYFRTALNAATCCALLGCATPTPPNLTPIASSRIINSVKCGLALALFKEQTSKGQKRLTGNIASLELQLKETVGQASGVAVAGVIPFQGGPTILPTFSASRATAWTVDSTINASYKLDATNTKVCAKAGIHNLAEPGDDPLGFSKWLGLTLDDLGHVSLEKPSGVLNSVTYEAAFGVADQVGADLKLQLAFLTADVSAANSRNDLQRLKIVISGATVPPKAASAGPGSGGGNLGTLFYGKEIKNFSSISPAE